MSYKPDQQELMAYLYDELDSAEKARVEQYLLENPAAGEELRQLAGVSAALKKIRDKEVIAPPVFIPDNRSQPFWHIPYFRTVASIAASLIIILLAGKFTGASLRITDNELRLSFGEPRQDAIPEQSVASLTQNDVQEMINESLRENNATLTETLDETRQKLERSVKSNLVVNPEKMDALVKQASLASREEVQQYVSTLQAENMKMVKDYFALTHTEQKQYIEGLLVDFAKYLQQQRRDDLQLVELRLNSLEQNTNVFQQETEQILTSIISSVGTPIQKETKY